MKNLRTMREKKNLKSTFTSVLNHWFVFKESCHNLIERCWMKASFFFSLMTKAIIVLTCMINWLGLQDLIFGNHTIEEVMGFFTVSATIISFFLILVVYHETFVDIESLNLIDFVESVWKLYVEKFIGFRRTTLEMKSIQ